MLGLKKIRQTDIHTTDHNSIRKKTWKPKTEPREPDQKLGMKACAPER